MKRLISLLLVFAVALSLCACGADAPQQSEPTQEQTETSTDATQAATMPQLDKDPYADVNELEPNEKGTYEIHSIEGLKNIANHLDGKFELLCDIDLGGADWVPIGTQDAPFTGKLNGKNYTISNFKITQPTKDGNMGFFGVADGSILNLFMKDVTITTTADTVNVGAFAGISLGDIRRSEAHGSITADVLAEGACCGGAAGVSEQVFEYVVCNVDLTCTAPGAANIGAAVGKQTGGKIMLSDFGGKLNITGGKNKNIGLFAGVSDNAELETNRYTGSSSLVDNEAWLNRFGIQGSTTSTGCTIRDNRYTMEPLPEDAQRRREKVVALAYEMATVEWTVPEPIEIINTCPCCDDRMFMPDRLYKGIPYTHKNGSLQRFYYCMDEQEDGSYLLSDWMYDFAEGPDGIDVYLGNDCSSCMQQLYATVSNCAEIRRSVTQFPVFGATYEVEETFPITGNGIIPVGDWVWDLELDEDHYLPNTKIYLDATGEEKMYECYAQLRAGDMIGNAIKESSGHCQIITGDAVVMLDENGKLDPDASYVTTIQNVAGFWDMGDYISSWHVDWKYTFRELFEAYYVPMTFPELVYGSDEIPEVSIEGGTEGRLGMTTGVVTSNFYIDSVEMTVTDDAGNTVLKERMFVTVDKTTDARSEFWTIRGNPKDFDLAHFTNAVYEVEWDLQKTYHCDIKAILTCGETLQVTEFDF